jgi:hypothetical protein
MFILGVIACDLVKSKNAHLIDGLKQLFKKQVWIKSRLSGFKTKIGLFDLKSLTLVNAKFCIPIAI